MTRDTVPIGRLYTLLNEELRRSGSPVCPSCRMPLPLLEEEGQGLSANWRIEVPPACPNECHETIVSAAAKVWMQYALAYGVTPQAGRPRAGS